MVNKETQTEVKQKQKTKEFAQEPNSGNSQTEYEKGNMAH